MARLRKRRPRRPSAPPYGSPPRLPSPPAGRPRCSRPRSVCCCPSVRRRDERAAIGSIARRWPAASCPRRAAAPRALFDSVSRPRPRPHAGSDGGRCHRILRPTARQGAAATPCSARFIIPSRQPTSSSQIAAPRPIGPSRHHITRRPVNAGGLRLRAPPARQLGPPTRAAASSRLIAGRKWRGAWRAGEAQRRPARAAMPAREVTRAALTRRAGSRAHPYKSRAECSVTATT